MRTAKIALAACIAATSVHATTIPALSGDYVVNVSLTCQPSPSVLTGAIVTRLLTVHFDPATGYADATGTETVGPLIPSGVTGFYRVPISYHQPYSNTGDTLTVGSSAWSILYSHVTKGIDSSYDTNGTEPVPGASDQTKVCAGSAHGTRM